MNLRSVAAARTTTLARAGRAATDALRADTLRPAMAREPRVTAFMFVRAAIFIGVLRVVAATVAIGDRAKKAPQQTCMDLPRQPSPSADGCQRDSKNEGLLALIRL